MARSIWSGVLSFGLVNINVTMHPATKSKTLSFHLLNKEDKHPIGYEKIDKADGKVLTQEEIVKGYEFEKGSYVVLDDEDFEKAAIKTGRSIDIKSFIDLAKVDPVYYQKSYYLAPREESAKAYDLLLKALNEKKKAAMVNFVLRDKQQIGLIRPRLSTLLLETMYYADEVVSPAEIIKEHKVSATEDEVELAKIFIERLSKPYEPAAVKDKYRENLLKIINAKIEGKEVAVPKAVEKKPVVDIMAALKESVKKAA